MSYRDDFPTKREGFRLFGWSVSATIGMVILVVLVIIMAGVFTWFWAPWKGQIEARNQTQGSGTYRIAAYDHFYDLCGDVQALEDQIDVQTNNPVPETPTNIAALNSQRAVLIREYNADSHKAGTLAQFKASDLPYELDPTPYDPTKGNKTQCAL